MLSDSPKSAAHRSSTVPKESCYGLSDSTLPAEGRGEELDAVLPEEPREPT